MSERTTTPRSPPRDRRGRYLRSARRATVRRDVVLLFEAIIAEGKGDQADLAEAESELLQLAESGGADFEEKLVVAAAAALARSLPNTSWEEVERAIRVDVRRHVSSPLRLARAEPWGNA
jgi:hypothetical protein